MIHNIRIALLSLGIALIHAALPGIVLAQTPPAATYYVATTGLDTNPGTATQPFATITHALTLCTGGQTVAVASGTYSTLAVTGTLSGIPTGAVVYDNIVRTSMVTVLGWGATPPLIQPPSTAAYMAVWINGGSYLTFNNFVMHSDNGWPLFDITPNWATGTPRANQITIENCDLSDPDSTHIGNETFCVGCRGGADNITVQNCYIHDSSAGIGGDGPVSSASAANHIQILNNTMHGFASDGIQFSNWNNVTIDGNTIESMYNVSGGTFHNDGIQFGGGSQNVTITNNVIAHVGFGQGMLIQANFGVIDNVLVANNLIYDNGDAAIQNGATHAVFINNTSPFSPLWLRLGYNSAVISDSVVANNIFGAGVGYFNGSTAAYEDYNYTTSGYGAGTGAHDILGASPGFVNTVAANYHPAIGSPLLHAGVQSFSATVDGVVTNFTAPTNDLDLVTRGNPPAIGVYETAPASLTTYAIWCSANNLTGNNALQTAAQVPDGLNNLYKYALGLQPFTLYNPGSPFRPVVQNQYFGSGRSGLGLTFTGVATDVTYTVQASSNLTGAWTTIKTFTAGSPPPGQETVFDTQTLGTTPQRYMRLLMTSP